MGTTVVGGRAAGVCGHLIILLGTVASGSFHWFRLSLCGGAPSHAGLAVAKVGLQDNILQGRFSHGRNIY